MCFFVVAVEELFEAPLRAISGASGSDSDGRTSKKSLHRTKSDGPVLGENIPPPDGEKSSPDGVRTHRRRSEVIRPPSSLQAEPFRQRAATQPTSGSNPYIRAMMTGKQNKAPELNQSELLDRFKKIIVAAVDYAIFACKYLIYSPTVFSIFYVPNSDTHFQTKL